MCLILY